MKGQFNRLPPGLALSGTAIDRSKPLSFHLDGRSVHGFAGDTVLSALLACGVDTVGLHQGLPLALTERHSPPVVLAGETLPMQRTPAIDGAVFFTQSPKNPLRRLTRPARSLGLDLDHPAAMRQPWLLADAAETIATDLIVVGGGVAGLSAALAAAKAGRKVILLEAAPMLGGHARLFGTLEGEETPEQSIARLTQAVAATEAITTITRAQVFAARPGLVRAHVVGVTDGHPTARVIDYQAPKIVLATGVVERLPLFAGNRLPGTTGTLEAFALAHHYGVWPGQSALFATVSNPAYRLAVLARDAGIAVPRILDSRPDPQSRFIEFTKAYGVTMAASTIPAGAQPASKGCGITLMPQLTMDGFRQDETELSADRLILCGGFQPDLTLWHMAGGASAWNSASARLEPQGGPPGMVLAGSASGWLSRQACLASGGEAVDRLLGKKLRPVTERLIDPIYETPDCATPIANLPDANAAPSYLDAGLRYLARPQPQKSRRPAWLPFAKPVPTWSLAETPQPLDLAAVAAGVQLGALPAASAGIVAHERVAQIPLASTAPATLRVNEPQPLVPAFLAGRFGENAKLFDVSPLEPRTLDIGALIYAHADGQKTPVNAIGVVVRHVGGLAIALLDGAVQSGQSASLREADRSIPIRIGAPFAPPR